MTKMTIDPKIVNIQRAESLAIFAGSIFAYNLTGYSWWWLAGLWISIDLFMVGYLIDEKTGALFYNLGHSYALPILAGMIGWQAEVQWLYIFSIIWISHVSLDRVLGYGLKNDKDFKHTHLGSLYKNKS